MEVTSGGDSWNYKSCKALVKSSPPTNQHPVFYTGQMPFLSPNQQCWSMTVLLLLTANTTLLVPLPPCPPLSAFVESADFFPEMKTISLESLPTTNLRRLLMRDFPGHMPFILPNQQCQSAEWMVISNNNHDAVYWTSDNNCKKKLFFISA